MSSSPWVVIDTDCNMTVLLPENLDITIEDEDLSTSIWIGVTNGSGDVVGTSLYTPGEVNAIAVWGSEGEIPGMDDGETLNWIVMNNGEVLSANVSYFIGDGTYNCNTMAGISSLTASSVVTQDISLDTGWNIWSTYVDPEDPNMASMLEEIVGVTIICKDENGAVYWPGFGLNNIGDHTPSEGYQIKMANNALLSVTGQMIDPNMTFNLEEGWGIIGYVKPQPSDAVDMMFPVVEDLIIMKDENGLVYWPAFGLNSIGNMEPGEGYQVKMFNDVMFSYTSGAGRLAYSEPFKTVHYDTPKNTGNNMTIGLPEIAWEIIPAIGDEIAAYDESGKLIGSTTFDGQNIALTVWGDDLTTSVKDGLAIGEKVTFKLWSSDTNTESILSVNKWEVGSSDYTVDGICIASNITISGSPLSDSYKLYQNVPNPFDGTTTVSFYVPESAEVTISVYNMLGEYVTEVTNDIFKRNSFNTAIAAIMELLNNLTKYKQQIDSESTTCIYGIKVIIKMLSPIAPHITQNIWTSMGEKTLLMTEQWPKVDKAALEESKKEIIIQINGKLRGKLVINIDLDETKIREMILSDNKLNKYIINKEIKKAVYIKGKLVNYVI